MKNLLEWTLVFLMCILGGALLILWPLFAFLLWNPLWLVNMPDWEWQVRALFLFGLIACGFVFYGVIRYGYKQ